MESNSATNTFIKSFSILGVVLIIYLVLIQHHKNALDSIHKSLWLNSNTVVGSERYAWRTHTWLSIWLEKGRLTPFDDVQHHQGTPEPMYPGIFFVAVLGHSTLGKNLEYFYSENYGIPDPLLSRLPVSKELSRRIIPAHNEKKRPAGYTASIYMNANLIEDSNISSLYEDVLLLTQGKLFTRERWGAILRRIIP